VALKKVTSYGLLFNHHLFDQLDIVRERFQEGKEEIYTGKKKINP